MLSILSRVLLFRYLDVQLVKKIVLFEHLVEDNLDIRFTIFFALVYFHLF